MFGNTALSASQQAHVLRDAKNEWARSSGNMTIRRAISTGLEKQKYWNCAVGSDREMAITREFARALQLPPEVGQVESWSLGKTTKEIGDAFDKAIAYLQ